MSDTGEYIVLNDNGEPDRIDGEIIIFGTCEKAELNKDVHGEGWRVLPLSECPKSIQQEVFAIDLFERYDSLPSQIKQIIDKYSNDDGDAMDIESMKSFERELGEFGYVFDWGLDMRPFNLRKGKDCTTEEERKAREDWDSRYMDEESIVMGEPEKRYQDKYIEWIAGIMGVNLSEEKQKAFVEMIDKIYQDGYEDGSS